MRAHRTLRHALCPQHICGRLGACKILAQLMQYGIALSSLRCGSTQAVFQLRLLLPPLQPRAVCLRLQELLSYSNCKRLTAVHAAVITTRRQRRTTAVLASSSAACCAASCCICAAWQLLT